MFLGHYGVALALKRAEPKLSLGTLFLAVQLCDLLWGAFLLLGWEHVRIVTDGSSVLPLEFYDYPISHSLLGTIIWSVVAAALYYSWPTRDTTRHWQAAALVGLAVSPTSCSTSWFTCPIFRCPATIHPNWAWGSGLTRSRQ